MKFITRASYILAMCLLSQCQAKVIYSETSYVDEYGNYYDGSAAYVSVYEIKSGGSGDYGSGYIKLWGDEGGDDDIDGSGSGHEGIISDYGSGFSSIWDDEGGDDDIEGSGSGHEGINSDYGSGFTSIWGDEGGDEDDFEGSGSGHEEITTISSKVFEEDYYENHKDYNVNRSIIFPDEDRNVENRKNSKVNIRELDHILEKEVEDENTNSLTENKVEISLVKGNEEMTSEEIKEILEEHTTENNLLEKKDEEFYFNKEVISNSESKDFFADPESVHSIYEDKENHDSSLGTMQIIMFTSAGILIVLVILLIIMLIVYLTSRDNKEKYTAAGDIKRIRLISTNSTMKI